MRCLLLCTVVIVAPLEGAASAAGPQASPAGDTLRQVDTRVLPKIDFDGDPSDVLRTNTRRRLQQANDRSRLAWYEVDDRRQWERFRAPRLAALKESLGAFPEPPERLDVRRVGTIPGDGFVIEKLLYQSRPGLWVTANLYRPRKARPPGPGILIAHSHHRPKEHGELQDMGMTWARAGCVVLVIDLPGHGERADHPFRSAADYEGDFRVSRQDYYFRYDLGMQLHLAGDSLIGWMAWDLMRGVDLLRAREDVDPGKIVLLGAVAGGGDVAAVTGAVDERIAAVGPFHFGGPQGYHPYPLPEDAETSFPYAGSGSWESTRNLRRSAGDGFLPWVIVGSVAPRRLIYGMEFGWDRERDPVWDRLQAIYGFYGKEDRLGFAHGRGTNKLRPPQGSHCTHIGRVHRRMIHPLLNRWFDVPVTPDDEFSDRVDAEELRCLTPKLRRELGLQHIHEVAARMADERAARAREERGQPGTSQHRQRLQQEWRQLLGTIEPVEKPQVEVASKEVLNGATVHRLALRVERDVVVPLALAVPDTQQPQPPPVVVAVAQAGKERLLAERAEEIAAMLRGGAAVCLPDVRGTGETAPGSSRERRSAATRDSSSELMLSGTLVGARLRDLRTVLHWLRQRKDVNGERIALWGDSLAAVNPPETDFRVPRGIGGRPRQSEPLGGMLALLGALYEDPVRAVYLRRGLTGFRGALESPFVWLPHDAVVPGLLATGDLADVAAALAPRPLRFDEPVDTANRSVPEIASRPAWEIARQAYRNRGVDGRLQLGPKAEKGSGASWIVRRLSEQGRAATKPDRYQRSTSASDR